MKKLILALSLLFPLSFLSSAQDPCNPVTPWKGAAQQFTPGCVPDGEFPVPPILTLFRTEKYEMNFRLISLEPTEFGYILVSPFLTSTPSGNTWHPCTFLDVRHTVRFHTYGPNNPPSPNPIYKCVSPSERAMFFNPWIGQVMQATAFLYNDSNAEFVSNTVAWRPFL